MQMDQLKNLLHTWTNLCIYTNGPKKYVLYTNAVVLCLFRRSGA